MDDHESLSHTKWERKYHVVFTPECRRKTLYAELRKHLGEVIRRLALQKESRIEETPYARTRCNDDLDPAKVRGVAGDRIHKGKSAIHLARIYG